MTRAIGGFFPLEADLRPAPTSSYINCWTLSEEFVAFHNLRGAFRFLLETLDPTRVWLPGYICAAMKDAVIAAGLEPHWYPVNRNLSPDIARLSTDLKPGDLLLAVDYFGRKPDPDFLWYVGQHPEIIWVEDRAQALQPGEPWGNYLLYSPRKLLGVPDGGIVATSPLVADRELPRPALLKLDDTTFMDAYRHRREDIEEIDNASWYQAFLDAEASMRPDYRAMSHLTRETLTLADAGHHAACRHANFRTLFRSLGDRSLLKDESPDYVPFGFPLVVDDAGEFSRKLAARRVFAPRYWPDMPAETVRGIEFLYEKVVTLPVDHRYGDLEMEQLITTVKTLL